MPPHTAIFTHAPFQGGGPADMHACVHLFYTTPTHRQNNSTHVCLPILAPHSHVHMNKHINASVMRECCFMHDGQVDSVSERPLFTCVLGRLHSLSVMD